jgi:hypothetical protein
MVVSMKKKGPYTFSLLRLGGVVYLDMLEQFLVPQLDEDEPRRTHSLPARRRTPSSP